MITKAWVFQKLFIAAGLVAAFCPLQSTHADTIWATTSNQFLVSWDSASPGTITSGTAITGLQVNEQILGIDVRPDDGQLFAIGSSNRLYTIGMDGVATQIGPAFSLGLNGSSFGYDFNPTIDRSRIDTNTNKNYVVNPNDGGITQVTDLFFAGGDPNVGVDPNVAHIAYTNSFAGAMTTQLYGIDTGLDILVTQANSAGTLGTVGSLGIDITEIGGFDISGTSGMAWAALQSTDSSASRFFRIDLSTGLATDLGQIGGGSVITSLAVQSATAVPEPSSAFAVAGLFGVVALRRRKR